MASPAPPSDPRPASDAADPVRSPPAPDLAGKTVWIVDTLSRVYQRFHAVPEMTSPSGAPVNAVHGFAEDLLTIVEKRKPDYLFCAMDAPGPTFRHERHADYKGTRAEMPADLVPQIPMVRELCARMGIPCLELAGYEADDILATIATRASAAGATVTIATSDKDARQLLSDRVRILNLRTGGEMGPDELRAEWGVGPGQVVDWLALVGDTADNVPGVPQIGPKAATELLGRYGDLETLLAHVDEVKGDKKRDNLRSHAGVARASRELVRLEADVPLEVPWEEGRCRPPEGARFLPYLESLGFRRLLAAARRLAPEAAPAPAAPRKRPGDRQGMLFGDEPASVPPPFERPADDAALGKVAARLRAAGGCAVAVAPRAPAPRSAPPAGVALVAGETAAWVDAALLAGPGPGRDALAALLADAALPKQAHDLKAQQVALDAAGIGFAGGTDDSLLAGYLLHAGRRDYRLEWLARVAAAGPAAADGTGDVEAVEGDAAEGAGATDVPRSAEEAVAAARAVGTLAPGLRQGLDAAGLRALYDGVEIPLAAVLARMEVHGLRIDVPRLEALAGRYAERLAGLEREIQALAGHPFSVTSPIQVRTVLFEELGLPVVKRTKTGASTDAEVLEELAPQHPLPRMLLEHRRFAKLKSTYVDALPLLVDPATGCIHTTFNQTVAATGRLSSSDPNLQNIPVRTEEGQQIRAAFLPRHPGHRLVAADYSQIELRILAHLSGDEAMRRAFASGEDIHSSTAAAVFGVAAGDVTPAMRRSAKAVNFGILYGQSAFGLGKALGIPQGEAAAFIGAYFRTFAGAAAFIDDVLDRCAREGEVRTMLGRRRRIERIRDRASRRTAAGAFSLTLPERTAVNTVVQGSAADLIKLAMLRVDGRLRREGLPAALVLQIHDELLLECPPGAAADVRRVVSEEMRAAMELSIPLEVSLHEGSTWAECEK